MKKAASIDPLVAARRRLAEFAEAFVPPSKRQEHSNLVAVYIAAAVRDDRARRAPRSIFEIVFGSHRL